MAVKPIPEGYHSVTPYLVIKGASAAIDFYKKAFDAKEELRMDADGGLIGHAEILIGDSHVMLADETESYVSPMTLEGSPVSLLIYLENVDDVFKRALDLGAVELKPVEDQFYGDRMGTLKDPFGHVWSIATHIEDVPPDEMERRIAAMKAK